MTEHAIASRLEAEARKRAAIAREINNLHRPWWLDDAPAWVRAEEQADQQREAERAAGTRREWLQDALAVVLGAAIVLGLFVLAGVR